jgi:hypothetical protein
VSPREVMSATDTRWSRVTPSQGGWFVRYGVRSDRPDDWSSASLVFFFAEADAHRAAKLWERDSVEPRSADTWRGMPFITDEQIEACRHG